MNPIPTQAIKILSCILKIYFFILDEFFQDWECYGDFDVLWFFWLQNIILHLCLFSLKFTFFIPGKFCGMFWWSQDNLVPNVGWQTCGFSFLSQVKAKDREQVHQGTVFPRNPDVKISSAQITLFKRLSWAYLIPSVPRMNGRHPSDITRIPSWTAERFGS